MHAPAIEIEGMAGHRRAAIRPVETHNVEILLLHPDAPDKSPFARLRQRIDVEYQATPLAQKLAPHILNLVLLTVEAVHIQKDHLQEAAWKKFRGEKATPPAENFVLY